MKFIQIILLFLGLVAVANGAKVNWNAHGKPKVEKSNKPIKGCTQNSLLFMAEDNNDSSSCSK
jgi:hypothetical protein